MTIEQDTNDWGHNDILIFTQDDVLETHEPIPNMRIEGRLNNIVWTRDLFEEGRLGPIQSAIDVADLYVYGWRKVNPLSSSHEIL